MNELRAKILPTDVTLVPLRGTLKMDFNGLLGIGDVKPSSVTLPAFGDHLDEHTAQGRVGNVRDTIAICFHVQLHGLVLLDFVFFDVLEIYAGVFNGRIFLAASNFNCDARYGIGIDFLSRSFRFGRWILRRNLADGHYCGERRTQ